MANRMARSLRPGATIGVVAPSSPVPEADLREGLERLHASGFRTVVGQSVLAQHGNYAGTDAERAADFNRIWADPAVDGIICARGGEGAMRILERIDWAMVAANPKFFCGFSDITALHVAMELRAGLVTFHGPMIAAFGKVEAHAYNEARLLAAMTSSAPLGEVPWPAPGEGVPTPLTVQPGVAEGRLLGGNLCLLAHLMGTPWEPDFKGRILLLEDVNEAPYRIDRMLVQFLLAGKLQKAAGILFGDSPSCMHHPEGKPSLTMPEVFAELLEPLGIPVLYGFPCGHTAYRATLPLGTAVRLDATAGTLTVLEPALQAR
ncbi:MAG TPA: LD-carboxypeptidase [Symbiobacteriaceae bacterium]|nr:LD-carboxypeptidase [Symbiobacteriaceae bacterium]